MIETHLTSGYGKMKSIARSMLADGDAKEISQPAYSSYDSATRICHFWLVTLNRPQDGFDQFDSQDEVLIVAYDHGRGG